MHRNRNSEGDLTSMIADYMEKGFLENIIDMFRHDSNLYSLIGELIQDERVRVRIGITALIEELKKVDNDNIVRAAESLLPLLDYQDPTVRGDAANLLGLIADRASLPYLEKAMLDKNPDVRMLAKEAIEEIRQDGL